MSRRILVVWLAVVGFQLLLSGVALAANGQSDCPPFDRGASEPDIPVVRSWSWVPVGASCTYSINDGEFLHQDGPGLFLSVLLTSTMVSLMGVGLAAFLEWRAAQAHRGAQQ